MSSVLVPKYLAISRQIESQIRTGHWEHGKIPSARDIARSHKVSIATASRALQVLQGKGLIQTVDRSGSYLADLAHARKAAERWGLCLRVTPGPWHHAALALTRSGFEATARNRGFLLDDELLDAHDSMTLSELQRRLRRAAKRGVRGVFFLPSRISAESARQDEALLEACRGAGLPVVLIERNLRGHARPLEHDLVAADDQDGGLRCTRHLLEQGRRRIAFVTASPSSSHEGRLAGYLLGLFHAKALFGLDCEPLMLEQAANVSSQTAYQRLADQVLAHQVDGLVCYQDYTAIGLIMELLTRGIRVPHDIAITGFDDLPIGQSFALGVTTYAFPSAAVAEEALRMMLRRIEDPAAPPIKVCVPGELIVRESSVSA
jgi:LacI family transcriptional regulator